MMETGLIMVIAFVVGITIGSFLNVCILRIPEHKSIIPASRCMQCSHPLAWYDMIPVFSYAALRGKCHYCKSHISIQYPLIELLNGTLYLLVAGRYGWQMDTVIYSLMVSALITLTIIDIRTYEIPVGINLFLGAVGILRMLTDMTHTSEYIIGMFAVSIPLLLLYEITKGKGIGGGDVKLMAASGLIIGWKCVILAFVLACMIGSVCHVYRMKKTKADHVLAMGPYLSVGILLAAFWGESIITWYMTTILGIL